VAADPIDRYLQALRRRLPGDVALTGQTIAEAERELRAAAARIEAGGLSAERAAAAAVARAPRPEAVAARFALDAPSTFGLGAPLRLALSIALAAAVLLSLAAARAALADPELGWAVATGLLALTAAALAHGVLALWPARRWGVAPGGRSLGFFGGLALLVLGGVLMIWTLYRAVLGGAWDGLTAGLGLAVALQGGLAARAALPRVWSPWL